MKNLYQRFLLGTTFLCIASVAMASVTFAPSKSRYRRGETITVVANVTRPGELVCFYERDSKYGSHLIGTAVSDANCVAKLPNVAVPTDPNRDNCYIKAVDGQGKSQGETRIPIG
jgi:hypothetical protein